MHRYGLSKIQHHLGITEHNVCAIGDDLYDMPMVVQAGHGIAIENGYKELKDYAVFFYGHDRQEGLVDVIDYIRNINNPTSRGGVETGSTPHSSYQTWRSLSLAFDFVTTFANSGSSSTDPGTRSLNLVPSEASTSSPPP